MNTSESGQPEPEQLTPKIYPDLPITPSAPSLIPYEDISDKVEKKLSDSRMREIQLVRDELRKNLKHYQKVLNRWKNFENVLKISSIIVVSGTAIVSVVTGVGLFLSPTILSIITAVAAGENVLSSGLIFGVTKKKKERYKKRIEHIKEYISKAWYLFEKIREDKIITLGEVNEFRMLINEYEKRLENVNDSGQPDTDKSGSQGLTLTDTDFHKLRESLKKQVEKDAVKEARKEMKQNLKNELVEKIVHG